MGHDNSMHTKSDPKALAEAEALWNNFLVVSKYSIILICVFLALMAAFVA